MEEDDTPEKNLDFDLMSDLKLGRGPGRLSLCSMPGIIVWFVHTVPKCIKQKDICPVTYAQVMGFAVIVADTGEIM